MARQDGVAALDTGVEDVVVDNNAGASVHDSGLGLISEMKWRHQSDY